MRPSEGASCAVHVTYCLTAELSEDDIGVAKAQLSLDEQHRRERFHFERDRREFTVAHAMLRQLLSTHGDTQPEQWIFTAGKNGKPQLTPQDALRTHLVFNLSHTAGLVACAVGRAVELGIDVERIDRNVDITALSERFFSAHEASALRELGRDDQSVRFIEIWTLKEAFVKAIGEGLSCPLDSFAFTFARDGSLSFKCARPTRSRFWSFALLSPSPEHRMALAIGTDAPTPPEVSLRPASCPMRTVARCPTTAM